LTKRGVLYALQPSELLMFTRPPALLQGFSIIEQLHRLERVFMILLAIGVISSPAAGLTGLSSIEQHVSRAD